jgi:cytochrome c
MEMIEIDRRRAATIAAALLASLPFLSGSSAAATTDPAADAAAFAPCAACHSTRPGENKIGPSLAGVLGRTSGSAPGFNYSGALKEAQIAWNETTLDKYLQNPTGFVRGTKMFTALRNPEQRQRVIAYLKTLQP